MKVQITKAQVIKAIESEPLRSGHWISDGDGDMDRKIPATCPVCAVGAVLRAKVLSPAASVRSIVNVASDEVGWNCSTRSSVEGHIANERWLAALSCFFESEPSRTRRKATAAFVRDRFPPSIVIDINGFKPRRGAKVVK